MGPRGAISKRSVASPYVSIGNREHGPRCRPIAGAAAFCAENFCHIRAKACSFVPQVWRLPGQVSFLTPLQTPSTMLIMVAAKDELFCRLAVRHGFLSKEKAIAGLRLYREDGKIGEGISAYLLSNGFLQREAVETLENAIAQRAAGHVADTRRRVPQVRGRQRARSHPSHRSAHLSARPGWVAAGPGRLVAIGLGMVVLAVCLIFIVTKMNPQGQSPLNVGTGRQRAATPDPAGRANREPTETAPASPRQEFTPTFTTAELKSHRDSADRTVTDARMLQSDGRIQDAILHLKKKGQELKENKVPAEILKIVSDAVREMDLTLEQRFQDFMAELKEAQSLGKNELVLDLLQKITYSCGPELRKRAEEAIKN